MTETMQRRCDVAEAARRMLDDGLVVGTSGNISARCGEYIAITPSGIEYQLLSPEDIVLVDLDGTVVEGQWRPTSELALHVLLYRTRDVEAVVHTHSVRATALSLVRDDVPPVHYQIADFGPSVRVAEYAPFGSDVLAQNVSSAMEGRVGCLMRNHGAVTVGGSIAQAYNRARQLEWLCEVWFTAQSAGVPRLLDDSEIERCAEKFTDYGQGSR